MLGQMRRWFGRRIRGRACDNVEPGGINPGSEVNYFGLAGLLMKYHGPAARAEATRLMQEALQEDDAEAVADWRAVEQAITLLSSERMARH